MKDIPKEQVIKRLKAENPWWEGLSSTHGLYSGLRRRAYFELFFPLAKETTVKRALLLMGPRRVGKTVIIHQAIQELIAQGCPAKNICYVSVDHPLYNGLGIEDFLDLYRESSGTISSTQSTYIFFDEIQYLREWEKHLKSAVDTYRNIKFVASGSAAAALRLKSIESGAGRFTDFLLPPLTFHEYLDLLDKETKLIDLQEGARYGVAKDMTALNVEFLNYLNIGGYPELVFSETIRADPGRFIKSDVIDKVLLRDLPSLYGISDIQELNYLFTTLAFNTADEVSLEKLSERSGVAKNTIKRYIEYLEAAFLIKVVHRIDKNAKRFERANFFKVYLTNPSIRSALFSPLLDSSPEMGKLAETGIFSQWLHSPSGDLHYARWNQGEVDIVKLGNNQKPIWAVEVKWSDRCDHDTVELKNLLAFCRDNSLERAIITTKSISADKKFGNIDIKLVPTALYCYMVGLNLIKTRRSHSTNENQAVER